MSDTTDTTDTRDHSASDPNHHETTVPTQAELYDDLRRIGELEDDKRKIQTEIDAKTRKLADAISHLDPSSLLHKMLSSALPSEPNLGSSTKRTPRKSAARKSNRSRK